MPKTALERTIDSGLLARGGGGASGGGLGALPYHDTLPGLTSGDPHAQYLNTARGDALYVPLARVVTAGNGLTGGGALSGNITLAVAVSGLGLSVGADAVTLASSSAPGAAASILATDSAGLLTLSSFKVGAAMTFASANNVASAPDIQFATSGLLAAESSIYIALDSTNTQDGTTNLIIGHNSSTTTGLVELFRFTDTGRLGVGRNPTYELDVNGTARANSVTTPSLLSTGNLTVTPAGDLILDPTGEDVLPGGSITRDLGDYNRKWRTLFAAELYVETLVAQDVLSTIGGRIEVTPTTTLIANLTNVATTMDVKHSNLRSGEYAYLMAAPGGIAQFEAIKVASGATAITDGYRYTIERNKDGTGANTWVAGDAVASLGKSVGEGHISLTATTTAYNHLGPTMTIYSRNATTAWNAVTPVVAVGNLESFVGYSAAEAGLAIGNDLTKTPTTGFRGLTADATNGLRMYSTAISMYNGATQTFYVAPDGLTMWLGPSSSNKQFDYSAGGLAITGTITANAGYIGGSANGWTIVSNASWGLIQSTNIRMYSGDGYTARLELGDGVTAAATAGVRAGLGTAADVAFWAGAANDNTGAAPFRVTLGGNIYAAGSGSIGDIILSSGNTYVIAPTTYGITTKGYKFKYGDNVAGGLTAYYSAGSTAHIYIDNNTNSSGAAPQYDISSYLNMRTFAGGAGKTATLSLTAIHSGSASYASLTLTNDATNRTVAAAGTAFTFNGSTVWHAGNDGAGSGLDADTLDGTQGSAFALLVSPAFTGTPTSNVFSINVNGESGTGSNYIDLGRWRNVTSNTALGTPAAGAARIHFYINASNKGRLAVVWPSGERQDFAIEA